MTEPGSFRPQPDSTDRNPLGYSFRLGAFNPYPASDDPSKIIGSFPLVGPLLTVKRWVAGINIGLDRLASHPLDLGEDSPLKRQLSPALLPALRTTHASIKPIPRGISIQLANFDSTGVTVSLKVVRSPKNGTGIFFVYEEDGENGRVVHNDTKTAIEEAGAFWSAVPILVSRDLMDRAT